VKHKFVLFFSCVLLAGSGLIADSATAQTKAYRQSNLASSVPNVAASNAPSLINPWAIAGLPGQPFFIADNGAGLVSVHDAAGVQTRSLGLSVPAGDRSRATPTGIASDGNNIFGPADARFQYVVVTQDGTISGYSIVNGNIPIGAVLARDDSATGAVYTALALLHPSCCNPFVAVANFNDGFIHTFTSSFELLAGPGSFHDPNLPAGYAPFGMQVIGSQLFITYALQDAAKRDPVIGAGNGVVDVFDLEGNFSRRFATGGTLNAPWGVTRASANFGPFSSAILISNFGDGTIGAFDPATGNFLGQLKDGDGKTISNPGIRGLAFRDDGFVDPNTLFFTAGINNGQGGLFGAITTGLVSSTNASAPATPINSNTMVTATVAAGPGNPGTPTGSVSVVDGGNPRGTAPVVDGVATLTFTASGIGSHAIEVHYSGDAAFLPSTFQSEFQVTGLATRISLAAPATAAHGSPVTMTATISSAGGTPAGDIVFHDGTAGLGSAPLNAGGVATLTVSTLATGTHSLTASFAGAGTFAGSTSATVTTSVSPTPDFSVGANPSGVTVSPGQSAPVMVTVTPAGGFASNVTLSCSSVPGITCTFGSANLVTTAGPASTTMNVNTTPTVPRYGFLPPDSIGLGGLLGALALLSLLIWRGGRFARARVPVMATAAVLGVFALSLTLGGCGYGSSYTPPQNAGPAILTVTAQSGSISHTATVNVTVH
jgi:uncharacterized protein (TIGR03118 family)